MNEVQKMVEDIIEVILEDLDYNGCGKCSNNGLGLSDRDSVRKYILSKFRDCKLKELSESVGI